MKENYTKPEVKVVETDYEDMIAVSAKGVSQSSFETDSDWDD